MSSPQALIVDDSRTAQRQLKRMLEKYDLKIDTALSAEEALERLKHTHPSVIFLDHHMKGMDGLSALKIIKDNPDTALIPVIMYTSERGSVYVSQARALGAQDILTKGTIQPASLERVLANLNIIDVEPEQEHAYNPFEDEHPAQQQPPGAQNTTGNRVEKAIGLSTNKTAVKNVAADSEHADALDVAADLMLIRTEMARQFEHQSDEIHRLAQEESQRSLTRMLKLQRRMEKQQLEQGTTTVQELYLGMDAMQQHLSRWQSLLLLMLIAIAAGFGYQLYRMQKAHTDTAASLAVTQEAILDESGVNRALLLDLLGSKPAPSTATTRTETQRLALPALRWALNSDWRFGYDEEPLAETRISQLDQLLQMLVRQGYRGLVTLEVNFGNVCLQRGEDGSLALAASDMPYANCVLYADTRPDFTLDDLLSIAYVEFRAVSSTLQSGLIDLQLRNAGLDNPLVAYPQSATTAGEWNAIALQNNRIMVNLSN